MGYATNSVFDYTIWDKDGNTFIFNTVSKNSISYDATKGYNLITIEDVLLDTKTLNELCSGKYFDTIFRLKGEGTLRSSVDGEDYSTTINVTACKIEEFNFNMICGEVSSVSIILMVPFKDYYGFQNATLSVK